jgi:hypothetical protein
MIHGEVRNLASGIRQAIIERTKPARYAIEPAGALVEHLVKQFPVERVSTDHKMV